MIFCRTGISMTRGFVFSSNIINSYYHHCHKTRAIFKEKKTKKKTFRCWGGQHERVSSAFFNFNFAVISSSSFKKITREGAKRIQEAVRALFVLHTQTIFFSFISFRFQIKTFWIPTLCFHWSCSLFFYAIFAPNVLQNYQLNLLNVFFCSMNRVAIIKIFLFFSFVRRQR